MEFNTLSIILAIALGIILILFLWAVVSNNNRDNIPIATNNEENTSSLRDSLNNVNDENIQLKQTIKELQTRVSLYKSQIELQTHNEDIQNRFIESNFKWNQYIYVYFNRISLFHPVYKKIREFHDACEGISENLNKKEVVAALKKALDQIDLSNQNEVREYWDHVGGILTQFVREEELTDSTIFHSITANIYESQTEYIESIIDCLNLLKENFSRFEKIANRSAASQFIHNFLSGCKDIFVATIIDIITGNTIGDVIVQWANSKKLSDSDFIKLYIETIDAFIEEAPKLILKIDDLLSAVYVKHMHIKAMQDLQFLSQIRKCTMTGVNGENVLKQWNNKMNSIHIDPAVHEKIQEYLNISKN